MTIHDPSGLLDVVLSGDAVSLSEWISRNASLHPGAPIDLDKTPLLSLLGQHAPEQSMSALLGVALEVAPGERERGNAYLYLAERGLVGPILFLQNSGVPFRGDESSWFAKLFRKDVSVADRRKVWEVLPNKMHAARSIGQMLASSAVTSIRGYSWEEMRGLAIEQIPAKTLLSETSLRVAKIFGLVLKDEPETPPEDLLDCMRAAASDGLIDINIVTNELKVMGHERQVSEMEARLLKGAPSALSQSPSPRL